MNFLTKIMNSGLAITTNSVGSIGKVEAGTESSKVFRDVVSEKVESTQLTATTEQADAMGFAAVIAGTEAKSRAFKRPTDITTIVEDEVSKHLVDPFMVGGVIEPGTESFDGKDLSAIVKYSVAGAYKNSYIDDASELVFPTLAIDPRLNGFLINIEVLEIKKPFNRSIGNVTAKTAQRTSLVKVINDLSALGNNDNLLIPNIVTDENDADYNAVLFNEKLAYTVKKRDEVVTTAPLAFDKNIAFLDISQTNEELKHGQTTDREELGTVGIRELHICTDPDDASKCLPIDLEGFNYQFTPSFDGDEKGVSFAMTNTIFTFNTSKTTMSVTGAPANDTGNPFEGLAENLTIGVTVNVLATGNFRDGTFIFSSVKPTVAFVKTSAGVELSLEEGDGKAVVDALADMEMNSVELKASTTNSTVRNKGVRGTVTNYSKALLVPYRESDVIEHPVVNEYDVLDDGTRHAFLKSLNTKINMAVIRSRQDGIVTLMSFFDSASKLSAIAQTGTSRNNFIEVMPSSAYVNPLIIDDTIDLVSALDSSRTGEKSDDISGVFHLRVADVIDEMINSTNYDVAHSVINPGEKIVVNIIGGSRVIRHLSKMDLGDNIILRTASISLPEMKDVFTVTLGTEKPIKVENKQKTVDILNFGVRGYAPTTYASLQVSNEETYGIIHNTPRYAHYILLPIGARFKVVGMDQVIATKITGNRLSI